MTLHVVRALLLLAALVLAAATDDLEEPPFIGEGSVEVGTASYGHTLSPTENIANLVPVRGSMSMPIVSNRNNK